MAQITENKKLIPMTLQFFADDDPPAGNGGGQGGENQDPPAGNGNQDPPAGGGEVTLESLMAEVAAVKAENARLKSTNDKLCKSEGELRKQLRAKMTAEEQEAEVKAEEAAKHDEYVKGLEKELTIIKATARFIDMGFDAEKAQETAIAEFDGDKETVNANIKAMMAAQRKNMEKELREQLLKDMPAPQSGNQSDVDYQKIINESLAAGDRQSAALAILNQSGFKTSLS